MIPPPERPTVEAVARDAEAERRMPSEAVAWPTRDATIETLRVQCAWRTIHRGGAAQVAEVGERTLQNMADAILALFAPFRPSASEASYEQLSQDHADLVGRVEELQKALATAQAEARRAVWEEAVQESAVGDVCLILMKAFPGLTQRDTEPICNDILAGLAAALRTRGEGKR